MITDGPILGTLAEMAAHPHPDFLGVYDRTQMAEVMAQWSVNPHAGWKAPAFRGASEGLRFASKVTTPYAPGSVHDYMHAKVTVVDDVVLTGSYNLSHSGEENAENLLELRSPALADLPQVSPRRCVSSGLFEMNIAMSSQGLDAGLVADFQA